MAKSSATRRADQQQRTAVRVQPTHIACLHTIVAVVRGLHLEEAFHGSWGCQPHDSFVVGTNNNEENICGSGDPPPAGSQAIRIAGPTTATSRARIARPAPTMLPPTSTSNAGIQDLLPRGLDHRCPYCDRSFTTSIGRGVHVRRAHPNEANRMVQVATMRVRWTQEEIETVAAAEADARIHGNVRFMNEHLMTVFEQRFSLDRLKGLRRKPTYKTLVNEKITAQVSHSPEAIITSNVAQHLGDDTHRPANSSGNIPSHDDSMGEQRQRGVYLDAIRELLAPAEKVGSHKAELLIDLAKSLLDGVSLTPDACQNWLREVFPPPDPRRRQRTSLSRRSRQAECGPIPKWRVRRRQYAAMQELFKKDMSRAAKLVLDGPVQAEMPSVANMVEFWTPILTAPSVPSGQQDTVQESECLQWIAAPVCGREIRENEIPLSSAAGLDNISSRQWRSVPVVLRMIFYNIILLLGVFPSELLISRTVFIPKKDGSSTPSEFRPVSVASVVVRQLHKILAARLMKANLVDERQRGMHDGCAENVLVLSTALRDAKDRLRQLHIVSLDVAKAFDSISHHAITSTLRELGLPELLVRYIESTYRDSRTILQVRDQESDPIGVTRGVRQGDLCHHCCSHLSWIGL